VANFFLKKIFQKFPFIQKKTCQTLEIYFEKLPYFSTHCSSKQLRYKRILMNFYFQNWSIAKSGYISLWRITNVTKWQNWKKKKKKKTLVLAVVREFNLNFCTVLELSRRRKEMWVRIFFLAMGIFRFVHKKKERKKKKVGTKLGARCVCAEVLSDSGVACDHRIGKK
jgi:hypothetical protein